MSVDEIAKEIGADSLGYLSVEAVNKLAEMQSAVFVMHALHNYPVPVPKEMPKDV